MKSIWLLNTRDNNITRTNIGLEPTPLHKRNEMKRKEINAERYEKMLVVKLKYGITLIEVPYWWDSSVESLAATIQTQRPELVSNFPIGKPIPQGAPNIG